MSIGILALLVMGQTPTQTPKAPQPNPPVVAPAPSPVPPPPAPAPVAHPRVDQKKPYMRVWYWPPTPVEPEDFAATAQGGSKTAPMDRIDPVHFPTNRSKVVDETEALNRLAMWMKANPTVKVTLDGYADVRGSKKRNRTLSESRAKAVQTFLTQAGVPEERIVVASHGAADPVKGETKEETYWLSRRVSLHFSKVEATLAKDKAKELSNPAKDKDQVAETPSGKDKDLGNPAKDKE